MNKEYKVELTLEEMDIIIDALKIYPCYCDTERKNKCKIMGKLMYKESKIYGKREPSS